MKRRLTPFLIGISVILIGSLVYAADKRKQSKRLNHLIDPVQEKEALSAELLEAVDGFEKKSAEADDDGKLAAAKAGKKRVHAKAKKEKPVQPL